MSMSSGGNQPTQQGVAEELIRFNLVQRRLEQDAVLTKVILLVVIDSPAELLGL